MNLKTPVGEMGKIFKSYSSRLEKLEIYKLEDLLYHFPSRYEDYSLISKINQVQPGEIVTIRGTVIEIKNEYTKKFKRIQKAVIADETGNIEAVWFNQPYLIRVIHKNDFISLAGKISWFAHKLILESPEYEIILQDTTKSIHTGRLVPIYPETKGVSSKWLRRQTYKILREQRQNLSEYLPDSILKNNDLIGYVDAIEQIHFPKSLEQSKIAIQRLSFDELFILQLAAIIRRTEWNKKLKGHPLSIATYKKHIEEFWEKLPFELTNSQKNAVKDIFKDLANSKPMNRLLEGDVGSGKTVVAAIAMYLAHLNGFQSVLMAPTEILANQHFATISNLLSPFGVKVGLATGSNKSQISNIKSQINTNNQKKVDWKLDPPAGGGNWKFDVLVGTHALLSEKINFDRLSLVVIDEQQRFGVEQRAIIRKKGENPHILTMTATPIPRTVALTLYGDLDLSSLDEMPKGRKHIKTWLVPQEKRSPAYEWIQKQIQQYHDQAFIICPFIEESESMQTVKAATSEYERLRNDVFKTEKVGMLHGKLKSTEKDMVLQKFKNKEFDILVATPVVEVGIDVPNATIMLIEASERFGLAQLHQLRGRIGRGEKQSYCLLFAESKSDRTIQRLKAMEESRSGAELAELDLKLRGAGDIFGTIQHGFKQLKIASFSDFSLIEKARKEAEKIFPELDTLPMLKQKISLVSIKNVSPD